MYYPVLRTMGRQRELKIFNAAVLRWGFNSVQKYIASVMFRFCMDKKCPVVFMRVPQEGDEPIPDLKIVRTMTMDEILDVWNYIYPLATVNFGEDCGIGDMFSDGKTVVMWKTAFAKGEWKNFEYCIEGKDGVSISPK